MFSKDDVDDYSDYLNSAIRSIITAEISAIINMSALAVSQLLEHAQNRGLELDLETGQLENQLLIEAVEKMTLDALPKTAKKPLTNISSFRDEAKAVKDESNRLDQSNKDLQSQLNDLRIKLVEAQRTIRELSTETKSTSTTETSSDRYRALQIELQEAREENNKRVSETNQFLQMRKLMQTQSAKIRDLRNRLQRYEPDQAKEEDD
eukprot:gene21021-27244_t